MEKNANILVAHDFSKGSSRALDYGIEFAVENNAALHFLHVEVINSQGELAAQPNKTKAQVLREKLRNDILNSLAKQGLNYTDIASIKYTVLRDVAAAPSIIDYCGKNHIDLVVLGTHGRRGFSRKILGSVAEEVVRLAPCTVFTVREQLQFNSLAESLTSIAVPFDFSDHSKLALAFAREMASSFHANLEVVHVIEDKLHPAFYQAGIGNIYDRHPGLESKVLDEMRNIFDNLEGPEVEVNFTVLTGHPVNELMRWTTEKGHNLIVIATHGLTGLDRAILGSVTERVVRLAPCPVITVKSPVLAQKPFSSYTETIAS